MIDTGAKIEPLLGSACCRLRQGGCILVASPTGEGIAGILAQGWESWLRSLLSGGVLRACRSGEIACMRLVSESMLESLPGSVEDIASFDSLVSKGSDRPWILASSADQGRFEVVAFVPPGLTAFQGHFPGQPVVPGALLLNWVGDWIKTELGDDRPLLELSQAKFSKIVQPCEVIVFAGSASARDIRFSISSRKGVHASGIFRFREAP